MAEKFPFQRKNINIENATRSDLGDLAIQPGSEDGADVPDDDTDIEAIPPVTNFRIVPGSEKLIELADGSGRVELILEWDDIPGAEDYEVWISGAE